MPDLYVPLDVNFQDDDKLLEVSAEAELMFVRSLALCKRLLNDGTLTASQARRLGDKLDDWRSAAKELVAAGLWDDVDGVFSVPAWGKHNRLADEVEQSRDAKRRGAALGNHNKWHRDRGVTDPTCRHCPGEERSDPASHSDRSSESHSDRIANPHSKVETETETEKNPPPGGNGEPFTTRLANELRSDHGTVFTKRDTLYLAFHDLLTEALERLPPDRHHGTAMGVIADFVGRAQGFGLSREARSHTARLVRTHDPTAVLHGYGQALDWGAGCTDEYASDPLALSRYVAGVLSKRGAA